MVVVAGREGKGRSGCAAGEKSQFLCGRRNMPVKRCRRNKALLCCRYLQQAGKRAPFGK